MSIEPPLFRRQKQVKKTGGAGRKAEKALAHRLGGKQTLASGAVASDKGDVKFERKDWKFLLESKSTQNESMSVKLDWACKIYQEALESNRIPLLAIQFTNDHGTSEKRGRWIAMPEHFFQELLDEIGGNGELLNRSK